jgi:hypothetical protein
MERKQTEMRAVLKITDAFRKIATEDPARYLQPFNGRDISEKVKKQSRQVVHE